MTQEEKAKATRIYIVCFEEEAWLVEASSSAQAVRHVTKPYVARVADQGDLVRLVTAGKKVEKAKED